MPEPAREGFWSGVAYATMRVKRMVWQPTGEEASAKEDLALSEVRRNVHEALIHEADRVRGLLRVLEEKAGAGGTVTNPPLPQFLMDYLAKRDEQHIKGINDFLLSLPQEELALLKDIAVMGYVRGSMRSKEEGFPESANIVAEIVSSCLRAPDLYPEIARRTELNETQEHS